MESGVPDPELIAAMQRFDDEMREGFGVLVAVERFAAQCQCHAPPHVQW